MKSLINSIYVNCKSEYYNNSDYRQPICAISTFDFTDNSYLLFNINFSILPLTVCFNI